MLARQLGEEEALKCPLVADGWEALVGRAIDVAAMCLCVCVCLCA